VWLTKILANQYSGKENHALESSIDEYIYELIDLIQTKYLSTEACSTPVDLARKIQYLTLDVISAIGFGQAFGDLKADADLYDYLESSEQGLTVLTVSAALGLIPILQWGPLARLFGPSEKDRSGFGKMLATARSMIETRLTQSTASRSDMLASFMRHGLTKEDLFSEAVLQILAGSETSATAIRSIMLYLITHPRVYAKLQAEIDATVRSGDAPAAPGIVSDGITRNLPYLQAVVQEGFRIHPPVTDEVPKRVPKDGDTVIINGKQVFLPGGTNIGYCVWGLNRSKEIFGEDADQFRPERWLLDDEKTNADRLSAMKRTTELIFGYGKYQCLGKPVAWMEICKVIFEVSH
jgi:cytochrome P450